MTIFLTILAGVATFVLGQIALKLLIDPVHEFKRVIANISHTLIQEAQTIWNPGLLGKEKEDEVSEKLKILSSRLNAQMYLIPKYEWMSKIFGLPSQKIVGDAAGHLIGLSNSLHKSTANTLGTSNIDKAQKICRLLDIYIPENERLNDEP